MLPHKSYQVVLWVVRYCFVMTTDIGEPIANLRLIHRQFPNIREWNKLIVNKERELKLRN